MSDSTKPLVQGSLLPLFALLLLFLVADSLALLFDGNGVSSFVLMGVFQAQAGIFCILAGTIGRAWIWSFLQSTALAVLSVLIFYSALLWSSNDVPMTEVGILSVGVIPSMLFCGCIPFLILRSWYGWHLSRSTAELVEPYSLRIEDFFMAMIVVASLLAVGPSSFGFATSHGGQEDLSVLLFATVISSVASLVSVVPVTIVYFRASTRRGRMAVLFLFASLGLVAAGAYQVGSHLWNGGNLWRPSFVSVMTMHYLVTSTVLFSAGLVILHWSGFRLRSIAKDSMPIEVADPLEQAAFVVKPSGYRKKNRIAAALIVLASIVITTWISYLKQERMRLAESFQSLNSTFLRDGGYVVHHGYMPVALRIPPTNDNSSLELGQFKGLMSLSLAGNQLTDDTLSKIGRMNSLADIDLSQSSLADSSLKYLSRTQGLQRLSLAGTQVTVRGINEAMAGGYIHSLDVGELSLDDEHVEQLHIRNINGLILRGNPITDRSLTHLSTLLSLDLSGTKCDGSEFGLLTNVTTLILDGTSVDDTAITNLVASNSVLTRLSLRSTKVTDATLTTLSRYKLLSELELGDGEITADGLEAVAFANLDRLALNSRTFQGSVFASWKPSIRRLDMSHSGISDSDVHQLASVTGLQELSLAHCDVSDECLSQLATMNLRKLDLTDTKVTAAMVTKTLPKTIQVFISPSQCSPDELKQPNSGSSLRIGLRYDSVYY